MKSTIKEWWSYRYTGIMPRCYQKMTSGQNGKNNNQQSSKSEWLGGINHSQMSGFMGCPTLILSLHATQGYRMPWAKAVPLCQGLLAWRCYRNGKLHREEILWDLHGHVWKITKISFGTFIWIYSNSMGLFYGLHVGLLGLNENFMGVELNSEFWEHTRIYK